MRCKKHFSVDVSSTVGVCASCLRERLCVVIGVEPRAHQLEDRPKLPHHRRHQPSQPPLVFPRSVSPYISHRKSDPSPAVDYDHRRSLQEIRFFSTPQVDPTTTKMKKKSKFHMISNLFRSRSAKSAPPASDPFSDPAFSVSGSISGFIYPSAGRRKKTTLKLFSLNQASVFDGHRGMSPDVVGEDDSDAESLSPVRFGCSPEPWRKTPSSGQRSTRASHVRAKSSPARGHVASGIGICLSPLMRPSPIRNWSGKGVGPGGGVEAVYSGEVRSTVQPHLSNAASFCSNRSRKLADFGKFNHNR